jgi:hypothetical protein
MREAVKEKSSKKTSFAENIDVINFVEGLVKGTHSKYMNILKGADKT